MKSFLKVLGKSHDNATIKSHYIDIDMVQRYTFGEGDDDALEGHVYVRFCFCDGDEFSFYYQGTEDELVNRIAQHSARTIIPVATNANFRRA